MTVPGVTMRVTPRVSPDGKILMRVEPQVSSVTAAPVSLGAGIQSPAFNTQTVQTTVLASDGEAVSVSPYTGEALGRIEFSDGSFIAPVLADNTLYILTQDADLIAYR